MKVVATTRNAQGTSASRRLRHGGKVPGVLYGGKGDAVAIEVEHNPLFHSLRRERFHASILDMELDGKNEQVLLRDFQMHPYRQLVMHVDFQRVAADQPIHMRVPLHFAGQEQSPAVKESGAIVGHVLSDVDISCLPKDLPEFIEVDLSALKPTDTIKVLDLKLPQGVKAVVRGKENPVVVSVTIPGAVVEEEPTAAPVAAAEVPATAQKAPATPPAGTPAAAAPEKKEKGGKEEKGDKKK
ncbi:MAG TPA: 50S ribosomal protein L25/general stress protein Ctc [Burkholderiaceae bacterium]|nr:50S ribosomal protein L25/general stress protein Ctc [Burkholderiaceae bacterium]